MESYTAAAPGRILTADQQAAVKAFYKPDLGAWLVFGVFLPLVLGLMAGIASGMTNELRDTEAMVSVGLCIGVAAIVLAQWLLRGSSRRKMARAEFIYQYGQPETVTFAGLTSEEHGHGKDRRSQTVINLLRGNEPLKIKTYDDRIITAFMLPQQVVYTHPTYPDVLVPGSLFAPGWATGPGSKPRVVEV